MLRHLGQQTPSLIEVEVVYVSPKSILYRFQMNLLNHAVFPNRSRCACEKSQEVFYRDFITTIVHLQATLLSTGKP